MGASMDEKAAVGHLLRRAGFGLSPADAETYRSLGYRRSVRRLLDELDEPAPPDPPSLDPYVPGAIQQAWLERMVSGRVPLAEKLALFWHGHFATSDAKVQEPALAWRQMQLFRAAGSGRFRDLVEGVSRDVAMIRWLDSNANRKGAPNENYARELQELFTLGIGNYTESDVREAARAFTGWGSRHHDFVFTDTFHDHGTKTVHGESGDLDGGDVVRILTGLPACHRFVAGRLLSFFSHAEPVESETAALADTLAASGGDLKAALFVLFHSPGFRATERHRCLVRGPVEVAVGALRAAGIEAVPRWVHGSLDRMGQVLFRPPSVKGWTSGTGWLGSAAVVERLRNAARIAEAAPAAAAWIEDVAYDGAAPSALRDALGGAGGPQRVALALGAPEFQLA
ncbi:MAG: DUF1800 domain-containing protein [Planctomycetaceae bacterium]